MKPGLRISRFFVEALRYALCALRYGAILASFALAACQQVDKPEVKGAGPLAVKMARGLTAPEFHAPIERWRTTHKRALDRGDFSERECVLCHNPKNSCNNCHGYIGARTIDLPEASILWPDLQAELRPGGSKEAR